MLNLVLHSLGLLSGVLAIQQADAGTVDWHKALIGLPTSKFSILDDLAIATTDAGVIAALHVSNGSVAWRHVLPASEHITGYNVNFASRELAVLSGPAGATLRIISAKTGIVVKETSLHKPEEGLLTEPIDAASDVVLNADGTSYVLTNGNRISKISPAGDTLWSWNASPDSSTIYTKLALPSADSSNLYGIAVVRSSKPSLSLVALSTTTGELQYSTPIPSSNVYISRKRAHPQLLLPESKALVWLEQGTGHIKYLPLLPEGLTVKKAKPHTFKTDEAYDALELIGEEGVLSGVTLLGKVDAFTLDRASLKLASVFPEKNSDAISFSSYTPHGKPSVSSRIIETETTTILELLSGEQIQLPLDVPSGIQSYTLLPNEIPTILVTSSSGSITLYSGATPVWERVEGFSSAKPVFLQLPEPPSSIAAASHEGEWFIQRVIRHLTVSLPQFVMSVAQIELISFIEEAPKVDEGLYKDPFSFRQLILKTTKTGLVVAIDGRDGTVVWKLALGRRVTDEQLLVMDEPSADVFLVGTADDGTFDGDKTVFYRFNGITGEFIHEETLSADPFKFAHIITLPSSSTKTLMIIDAALRLDFFPTSPSGPEDEAMLSQISIPLVQQHGLTGYGLAKVAGAWKLQPTWQFTPLSGARVVEAHGITPNAGDASAAPAASFGKVIPQKGGGRNVLYKYLNPRILWTLTSSPITSQYGLHLVDGVKGTVVYSVSLPSPQVKVELVENWLVYAYMADDPEGKGWRIVSVELYEGKEDDLTSSPDASSFELLPVANVTTFERTFVLPHWFGGVTAIRTSTTKRGVAGRDLLVSTTSSHIVSLPYKVLNPRRPPHGKKPTAEETEEGLVPYDPVLLGDGKTGGGAKRILSHVYRLEKINNIITHPTLLESTSLVLGYGELDIFLGRVSPSGTFDRLSEGFNKPQLILTILGLSIGIAVVRPIVMKKALREKWYY